MAVIYLRESDFWEGLPEQEAIELAQDYIRRALALDPDLAEAYVESSTYSPVQHDLRKPKEKMLLERIRNARAEAAIVAAANSRAEPPELSAARAFSSPTQGVDLGMCSTEFAMIS